MKLSAFTIAAFSLLWTVVAWAQGGQDADFQPPCEGKPWWVDTDARFSDFDFWVGEWQVYDAASGELRGFDDVGKDLGGCILRQRWRQMDDNFSQAGLPWRLQGVSVTGLNADGVWRQLWTDNNGGNMLLTGGYDSKGEMVLTSEWYPTPNRSGAMVQARSIWHWAPQDDGTIKNWGYIQSPDENAEKRKYFDIVYRPNVIGSAAAKMRAGEN
jgi:hypothetical protein